MRGNRRELSDAYTSLLNNAERCNGGGHFVKLLFPYPYTMYHIYIYIYIEWGLKVKKKSALFHLKHSFKHGNKENNIKKVNKDLKSH